MDNDHYLSLAKAILSERVLFTRSCSSPGVGMGGWRVEEIGRSYILKNMILFVSQQQVSLCYFVSDHTGKKPLSCIVNTKTKTTTKKQENKSNIDTKDLFITLLLEKKTLEYHQFYSFPFDKFQLDIIIFYHLISLVGASSFFAMETENT